MPFPDQEAEQEPPLEPIAVFEENGIRVTRYPPRAAHGVGNPLRWLDDD